ncbi:MAG: WYL domain-containing protein [Saprospiraceae bacterium]|nr:WYL domain-containing protein [Saprospiraceae bacterium]
MCISIIEIISKLLSFGDDLEVMSPPSLRDEMRGKVLKMASKYVCLLSAFY